MARDCLDWRKEGTEGNLSVHTNTCWRWGFEQPVLLKGVPTHGRGFELDDL